jgi:hypothetical protein
LRTASRSLSLKHGVALTFEPSSKETSSRGKLKKLKGRDGGACGGRWVLFGGGRF